MVSDCFSTIDFDILKLVNRRPEYHILASLKKVRFEFQLGMSLRLSHSNQSKVASPLSYLTPFWKRYFFGSFSKLLQSFK